MGKIIYLDNPATTKVDAQILKTAIDEIDEIYFNPSSLYRGGREAKKIVESARDNILKFFKNRKLLFTSCGTEADNTAIFSYAKRGNVVTTLGEHSAVYKSFETLKQRGIEVRYVKIKEGGFIDEEDFVSKIDEKTTFVSVIHVNNETGAINDINKLAKIAKSVNKKLIFHSDGVQAFGKIEVDLSNEVDLYSISAHKICGLKGVGALIYNKNLVIQPYIIGGGQENGLRSGTENVLGISVFGKVSQAFLPKVKENLEKIEALKKYFIENIDKKYFKVITQGDSSPYIISLSAFSQRGAVLQNMLDDEGVLIGTGSACLSKNPHSRVISSFITDKKVLDGMIRVGFIYSTTLEEVQEAVAKINACGEKLFGKINL